MLRRTRFLIAGLIIALAAAMLPAQAARSLLDFHRLDAYFALYAHDANVPWKPATVRLDTYTSAPVDFAVYKADPADVLSAGSNARPRAIDTHRLRAVARWRYVPPGGYRFQSNDVTVPLGSREGFFVVEARRGNVGEQVWINRTRVGLVTKETPNGIVVYAADLGTGRPFNHMRLSFIVRSRFVDRYTDRNGLVTWRGTPRPVFALGAWGDSIAFVSFLPQAPLPSTIVGVKTASAVVHAGEDVDVVGFARSRSGSRLRAGSGSVQLVLRSPYGVAAQTSQHLDAAGAFSAVLHVPEESRAGEYTVIATAGGATAATAVHVDANAGGISLQISPQCEGTCRPDADIPVSVTALRNGLPAPGVAVNASIIRSPHVYAGAEPPQTPWGIAQWYGTTVTTGSNGRATIEIPHPNDGLASTYGVRVTSGGATADTRLIVPTSRAVLRVDLAQDDIGSGTPASFDVSGNDAIDGKPLSGTQVRVQLVHGASVQEQTLTLDDRGHAHGSFRSPQVGSNLIVAFTNGGDRAMDAAQIQVEPQTLQSQTSQNSGIEIRLDRKRYAAGEEVRVRAGLTGAQGNALITLESAAGTQVRVVPVRSGGASASFRASDEPGVLSAGAAFVRDGALQWDSAPLELDAPGRPLSASLELDKNAYEPAGIAIAKIAGAAPGPGTLIARITRGTPSGSALFLNAPDLLAIGTTATQDTAPEGASWHPWVDSTGAHAIVQSFARRSAPPADLTMTQADTASLFWRVERHAGDTLQFAVPATPGKYVLSLLKIDDDGRVAAASSDLIVR
jgi:hypothetical protein